MPTGPIIIPEESLFASGTDTASLKNLMAKVERTFLQVGTQLGKYTIIEEIDRGGMAVVYKALQTDLDREVALKVMPANLTINSQFLDRFLSEAHAVAKLSHPNIVNIHEVAVVNNTYFIAMDYIPGRNLYYHLHFAKPKVVDVLEITGKLCEALAYAHFQRIIHRDLKLNNVIMRDNRVPVLIDFGLAKAMEGDVTNITRTGEIVGSPAYMAPERLLGGSVDHRSDICSLGIMLYEMLTFKNPYLDQRSIHQTTKNVIEANPIPPRKLVPWLPSEIEAITLKAMHADPAKRYQTVDELHDDIRRYQNGESVLAQPPTIRSRLRYFLRKYWPYLTIAAIIILFSALFGVQYFIQSEKGRSHWQLLYEGEFNNRDLSSEWKISVATDSAGAPGWLCRDGALVYRGTGGAYVTFQRSITRDARVEFDITGLSTEFFDVGAFLYGEAPDSGYGFHLHRDGVAQNGMTYKGNRLLLYDNNPVEFPTGRSYHVELEKKQQVVSYWLNGVCVTRRWDFFPPLGHGHQKLGFFTRGSSFEVRNLRIFQRAIPRSPSPTVIADRFWERGDFQAALEEYRGLHLDFSNTDIAGGLQVRIPDCLIRLGRYDEALVMLDERSLAGLQDENSRAHLLFMKGLIADQTGRHGQADSIYDQLLIRYPINPAGQSAVARIMFNVGDRIAADDFEGTHTELAGLARNHPQYAGEFGKLHLSILDAFMRKGQYEKVVALAEVMEKVYEKDDAIVSRVEAMAGVFLLGMHRKQDAVDLLNRCIATRAVTEGVWEAWMTLASVYENDQNVSDAATIYRKVYRECPHGSDIAWMARIKMGELSRRASLEEATDSIFEDVIRSAHPFPVPRMIAMLHRGRIADNQFADRWRRFYGTDNFYLYHLARKAILNNEKVVARTYLKELLLGLPPNTWRYMQVYQLVNTLEKW